MPDVATAGERTISPPASPPVRAPSDDTPQSLVQVLSPLSRMAEDAGATDPGDAPAGSAGSRINVLRTEPFAPRVAARVTGSPSDDPAYGTAKAGTAGASSSPGGPFSTVAMASGGAAASVTNPFGVMGGGGGAKLDGAGENSDGSAVPEVYRLRTAPNRSGVVAHQGGSAETEAAVNASLKWLAANQSSEGWWDPRAHGAGKDDRVLGHSHENAGAQADTGITGLVLLSFLASGHTHQSGDYQDTVRRGLEYLMRTQARDGSLGGQAAMYEFMYCHAMATCALSEAYGMTRDKRLRRPVELAIAFTVAAQDPVGGGWRYRPGMPGDTSQLGWQLMALKSADLAGIPMSESTRQGIIRYLRSVSAGKAGGMASYRPGEQVTRTMSAEALVCWQFLGLPREHPACGETGDLLLNGLPGAGENNLYYWYYATLGMYQLQGDYWERWNDALRRTLVGRQVKDGPTAGSWDNAGDLWGGHGGRVYSTALATLTLEVYYRFLPIYSVASFGSSRPQ
jgi:hypothetical protein